jgi:hypothetical protein
MKKIFNELVSQEKERNISLYRIINDGQISLKDRQALIDKEVNSVLNRNGNVFYCIAPKVDLMCCSINERLFFFNKNKINLIRNKYIREIWLKLFDVDKHANLSLVLLSLIAKIFIYDISKKITITNFAVLLCKLFVESLINQEEKIVLEPSVQLKIGMILFGILEEDFVFNCERFKLFINCNGSFIRLSNGSKEILRLVPLFGNHHPLLVIPSNYSSYNHINKDRLFFFNMYHISCDCGLRKKYTIIDNSLISTLNYLQSQPFVINQNVLNDVLNNPLAYLEEFDESKDIFLPLKYKGINEYLKELCCVNINEIKKAIDKFSKGVSSLDLFIKTLVYADLYKNEVIFFNTYLDWRGRIYYNGYPLNPQSYKLCKRLLKLKGANIMCSFDVTASGFQILGLLMCDVLLLEKTNFLTNSGDDIYEYILKKYKEYIHKKLNIAEYPFLLNENFNTLIFNRKMIKNLSMCLIYTEGNFSRANKIGEALESCSFKINNKVLIKLASLFKECVYESILSIDEMSKNFNLLLKDIKSKEIIHLESSKRHLTTIFSYPKQEVKRVVVSKYPLILNYNKQVFVIKEKKNIYVNIVPYKNDVLKLKRSLFPNFIHQVDSLILHKVVQKAKEKNICLYTIHDCFVCDIENKNIINEFYYQACIDLINSENPLLNMFNKNNTQLLKKSAAILDEIVTQKQYNKNILKKEIYDIINH